MMDIWDCDNWQINNIINTFCQQTILYFAATYNHKYTPNLDANAQSARPHDNVLLTDQQVMEYYPSCPMTNAVGYTNKTMESLKYPYQFIY